jgi:predicted signal transduction protein with EAL and GGDEF domain
VDDEIEHAVPALPAHGPTVSEDWRAWASSGAGSGPAVTSLSLAGRVPVRNRLFPKTRSWIALGLPLELISPLSVLRIILALAAIVWPVLCWVPGVPPAARWAAMVSGVSCAAIWCVLLRVRTVGRRMSVMLTGLVAVGGGTVLFTSGRSDLRTENLLMLIVMLIFTGMFLQARSCLALQAVLTVGVGLAWGRPGGVANGMAVALAATVGLGSVTLAVKLLVNSARRHAVVDADTGLVNGAGLSRQLETKGQRSFTVAVISLTGVPEVREALGHRVGAELIRRAVEDLGQVAPVGALFGRVEGDELVVCVPLRDPPEVGPSPALVAATEEAGGLADMLLAVVSAGRYLIGDIEITLGAHVGLALAPWDGTDPAEVVRRAALSARRARASGQRWQMWSGTNGSLTAEDLALLAELRLAGERGELRLVYQPQTDAGSGAVLGVEALIRWDSPRLGAVPPGRFIPLAERTGLIARLTDWVFTEALDAQTRWQARGMALPVAVNLSAKLLGRVDLADEILAMLDARGLSPSLLTLELTETAATTDVHEAVRLLQPLHDRGVRISIDDFGTGYTSLAILPLLPLDELKVDQGFVFRSSTSKADEAIVRSVRELGHRLGLEVVAEGVEDLECAQRMTEFGFDRLQGYHLGRPVPEDELLRGLAATGDGSDPVPAP